MNTGKPTSPTALAVEFLDQWYEDHDRHLVSISLNGKVEARTFTSNQRMSMWKWIENKEGSANVYFHVNILVPSANNTKASKDDIVLGRALHVDIDDPRGIERLRNFSIPPTAIIDSGNGAHGYWLLTEPTSDLDKLEAACRWLEHELGGDHCHNRDRIMRLPGTMNLPSAKKVKMGRVPVASRVVEMNKSRKYSLDEFPTNPPPAGPKGAVAMAPKLSIVELEQLPVIVEGDTRSLIEHGDDIAAPRGGPHARFPSRSEAVFRVCCELLRAGLPKEDVAGIILNPRYKISVSLYERGDPSAYAWKQVTAAELAVTDNWPDVTNAGKPKPTMRNAITALLRLELTFGYDRFRYRKIVNGQYLREYQGQISDDAVSVLRGAILEKFGFDPLSEPVRDAANQLCLDNPFHPVLAEIDRITWDGLPRLDTWLSYYLGADETDLNSAIGKIVLVAAVRRVRQPGVKFDEVLILEGKQGSGKSSALAILAGPDLHSDQEILTQDSKTQMELMEGIWIFELGEVEGFNKAEVNKIKAFVSRQVDRSRPAYGRFVESRPRQVIFIGTTNDPTYLRDTTGNRRFWPVKTNVIDLVAIRRDREQLWAEAASLEKNGTSIGLPKELWGAAAVQQNARLEDDPWVDILRAERGKVFGEVVRIETSKLLERLNIPLERQSQYHTKRVATIMRQLGWEAKKFRVDGMIVRGYERWNEGDQPDDPSF
jgi:predicted P-loop ATPase